MPPIYGQIIAYTPKPGGGFFIHVSYEVVANKPYDVQFSPDGGLTWTTAGTLSFPPLGTVTTWNITMACPGGVPLRLVPKA